MSSKFSHRPKSSIKSTPVKGILKNKLEQDANEKDMKFDLNDTTPRSSYQHVNDTTASGTTVKIPGSSSKRVQFDGLPHEKQDITKESESDSKHSTKASVAVEQHPTTEVKPVLKESNIDSVKTVKVKLHEAKRVPFGNLYTLRRENSAPNLTMRYMQNDDPNTRSQITSFINKLRLEESAKLKRAEENIKQMEKLDKEIAKSNENRKERFNDKLRRPRIKSAMFKSADNDRTDSNINKHSGQPERVKSASYSHRPVKKASEKENGEKTTALSSRLKPKLDVSKRDKSDISKDLLPSNSFLLSKINGSDRLDKARRQRAFSAYTRHNAYRPPFLKLWKPSESNCYKDETGRKTDLDSSKQTQVTNYCDSGKTNQILGWLYDITTARSEDTDLECVSSSLVNEGTTPRMEDEYIPSID